MKKFKKLIPAFCMLLISAVLMGTSTYAWFSMNTKVTASGMQVNAKANSQFLQIVNSNGTFQDNAAQVEAKAVTSSKDLRPVTAVAGIAEDKKSLTELTSTTTVSNIKWAEAFSNDPASSAKATDYSDVSTAAKATTGYTNVYTLINSFKVRLNPKTGATTASNLKVQSVAIDSTNTTANDAMKKAVRVLIVCGEKWSLWGVDTVAEGSTIKQLNGSSAGSSVILDEITTAEQTVSVYVYFDGEHADTTTNNAVELSTDGYKVEFVLAID